LSAGLTKNALLQTVFLTILSLVFSGLYKKRNSAILYNRSISTFHGN